MDRAFSSGSSASPPTAPASPSIGYATAGNPGTGTAATKPGPWWYHMMTEEIRGVLVAAGLTPAQGDVTQLLQALPAALASRPEMARSLLGNGYQKLPGGLILQWGIIGNSASDVVTTLPIAFPTAGLLVMATNSYTAGSGSIGYIAANFTSTTQITTRGSSAGLGGWFLAIGK